MKGEWESIASLTQGYGQSFHSGRLCYLESGTLTSLSY